MLVRKATSLRHSLGGCADDHMVMTMKAGHITPSYIKEGNFYGVCCKRNKCMYVTACRMIFLSGEKLVPPVYPGVLLGLPDVTDTVFDMPFHIVPALDRELM